MRFENLKLKCNKRTTKQHDLIIIFMFIFWEGEMKSVQIWRKINLNLQIKFWKMQRKNEISRIYTYNANEIIKSDCREYLEMSGLH